MSNVNTHSIREKSLTTFLSAEKRRKALWMNEWNHIDKLFFELDVLLQCGAFANRSHDDVGVLRKYRHWT